MGFTGDPNILDQCFISILGKLVSNMCETSISDILAECKTSEMLGKIYIAISFKYVAWFQSWVLSLHFAKYFRYTDKAILIRYSRWKV